MKYFVTGATGFIGSYLCHRLVEEGHEVVALVRSEHKQHFLPKRNVEILRGDLSIFKQEDLVLPKCDIVYHLAAELSPKSEKDWFTTKPLQSVKSVIESLHRQSWTPKRFLFSSSLAATGPVEDHTRAPTEESPLQPIEGYGYSKKIIEHYLLNDVKSFPITIFRPPSVIGPEPRYLSLFKIAKTGYGIGVRGVDQYISFIFIDDLVEAMVRLSYEETKEANVYFTAYEDQALTFTMWKEIGKAMGKNITVMGVPKGVLYMLSQFFTFTNKFGLFSNVLPMRRYQQITKGHHICDSKKIERLFNWKAKYDLVAAIQETHKRAVEQNLL